MPVHVTDDEEELVDNVTDLLRELYHPGQVVMCMHPVTCFVALLYLRMRMHKVLYLHCTCVGFN